jgi:hypothetical protein
MADRKLAFYEIGKDGNYAAQMQAEFEKAQHLSIETGRPVKVVSWITVEPPQNRLDRFGQISFEIKTLAPSRKSIKYTTEIEDGVIVASDENEVALLQESLQLKMPEIVPEEVRKGNGN